MPAEELALIFEVLEGGKAVAGSNIIQFPVDAAGAGAATSLAGEGVSTAVQLGNGSATAVSQLTVIEGGASTTTGIGILGMEVGVAGAAIAPALGVLAGVGLYNLAPEFWTNVSNKLVKAGQTVGGKVRAFLNGETQQVGLSKETIEIFKQAFIEEGLFDVEFSLNSSEGTVKIPGYNNNITFGTMQDFVSLINKIPGFQMSTTEFIYHCKQAYSSYNPNNNYLYALDISVYPDRISRFWLSFAEADFTREYFYENGSNFNYVVSSENFKGHLAKGNNWYVWYKGDYNEYDYGNLSTSINFYIGLGYYDQGDYLDYYCSNLYLKTKPNEDLQPDATYPSQQPFPETYPEWLPWTVPPGVPSAYPIEIPQINPYPNQHEAQDPAPNPDPAKQLEALLELLPLPNPNPAPEPAPQPQPQPDPEPQPQPDPLPDPAPAPLPYPDPVNPNPPPTPSPTPLPVIPPATVPSNRLFTVYNPSISQLNQLGGYLWAEDIISQLLKMWQNPLDGIISLQKVYAAPATGGSSSIILGYLDSGVVAPVVTSQFATIDCGSVNIPEVKRNATDYTPYVDLHLYLPFIGFVELDPDEFMNGSVSVVYKVDMYTGTCLADVKCTRSADMPGGSTLYQFSGNASQQIPLTAGTANGLLSSLVSVVGAGLAVASGGALATVGAAAALGHSLTHEMLHVGHSGSLSANAGIMGSRYPAVIIGRRQGYDANGYNELYGYPANKTVYLGNLSGYARVKAGRLRTKATQNEKDEIMSLLKKGVIL